MKRGGHLCHLPPRVFSLLQLFISKPEQSFSASLYRYHPTTYIQHHTQANMSIEQWADAARRAKYYQDAEHQRATDTLQNVLQGQMTSDSAAGTIVSIYEPLLKRDPRLSPVATLWGIFCDTARALGGDRDIAERLVGPAQLDRAAAGRPSWTSTARPSPPHGAVRGCVLEGSTGARHDRYSGSMRSVRLFPTFPLR